jgi:hypothetical protein
LLYSWLTWRFHFCALLFKFFNNLLILLLLLFWNSGLVQNFNQAMQVLWWSHLLRWRNWIFLVKFYRLSCNIARAFIFRILWQLFHTSQAFCKRSRLAFRTEAYRLIAKNFFTWIERLIYLIVDIFKLRVLWMNSISESIALSMFIGSFLWVLFDLFCEED